ncbi:hypothetical protein WS67_06870 [Burkholderia singularis]|uniref:Uncharacterized protein n=1 Tax=Burkholderia singularis TaxID=1503053 RepID=A0A103E5K8_9BURK|nr:hypothetical protein WS67_06870 [Burkholderia singularis]
MVDGRRVAAGPSCWMSAGWLVRSGSAGCGALWPAAAMRYHLRMTCAVGACICRHDGCVAPGRYIL